MVSPVSDTKSEPRTSERVLQYLDRYPDLQHRDASTCFARRNTKDWMRRIMCTLILLAESPRRFTSTSAHGVFEQQSVRQSALG